MKLFQLDTLLIAIACSFLQPLPLRAAAPSRGRGVEDVCWTLFNAPEFCWNH